MATVSRSIGETPGQLVIGPLASTEMACAPAANAAETRYLTALQHAKTFTVQDGKLLISYTDGDTARTLTYSRYVRRRTPETFAPPSLEA